MRSGNGRQNRTGVVWLAENPTLRPRNFRNSPVLLPGHSQDPRGRRNEDEGGGQNGGHQEQRIQMMVLEGPFDRVDAEDGW